MKIVRERDAKVSVSKGYICRYETVQNKPICDAYRVFYKFSVFSLLSLTSTAEEEEGCGRGEGK